MLSTASAQSSATQLVQQFKLLKSFKFPKHKFGKKGEERELLYVCVLLLIHIIYMYDNNYTQIQSQSKQFLNFGACPQTA